MGVKGWQASIATQNSKFKRQNSKSLYNKLFKDFGWGFDFRRTVLVIGTTSKLDSKNTLVIPTFKPCKSVVPVESASTLAQHDAGFSLSLNKPVHSILL